MHAAHDRGCSSSMQHLLHSFEVICIKLNTTGAVLLLGLQAAWCN
jgi:hypothetical protein